MFGAVIFLSGLLAVGVPVAIHILARQRTRKIAWGAMPFLHESISSASSRRNRLKDWLLLLLRALAILFLVLTFAQPLASRLLVGGADLETVYVWDISLSSTALDERSVPVHESLKEALLKEIDGLPDRSRVRILLAGAELRWLRDEALELSPVNRKALGAAIRKQGTDFGGSQLATAALTALSAKDDAPAKTRQLVVLHDGRRQGWQEDDANRWKSIRQRLAADRDVSLRALTPAASVRPDAVQLSVNDLESDRDTIAMDSPVRFRATVRNHSFTPVSLATVIWRIDGSEVERAVGVALPAGEELKIEQILGFDAPGSHRVECEVNLFDDAFPGDNTAAMAVSVPDGLPVLIVDDTVKTQKGQILPSEFIAASLGGLQKKGNAAPDATKGMKPTLFKPAVITGEGLTARALEGTMAVVIAKADSLPEGAAGALRNYVEGGGGLWIMMDSSWEGMPGWMTELLGALGLDALADTQRKIAKSSDSMMKIIPTDPLGPFALGMAADRLDLFRAEVMAVHDIRQKAFIDQECLLETEDGSPVLLNLGVGSGRVILQTTDLGRANTNLPLLQCFVPLVREAMRAAAEGALPRRNLDPGDPIRLPVASSPASDGIPRLRCPDDSTKDMVRRGEWHEMAETLQPGTYAQVSNQSGEPGEAAELFTVRRPGSESDLEPISPAEIAKLINATGASAPAASGERREGRWPLAWLFAILTGMFFLAEALLAHGIARRRDATGAAIDLKPVF